MIYYLYVLYVFKPKKFYIGITKSPERRIIHEHMIGEGSKQTQNKRIKLLELYTLNNVTTRAEAEWIEKCYSYYLGSELGCEKVTYGHKVKRNTIDFTKNIRDYETKIKSLMSKTEENVVMMNKINNTIKGFYSLNKLDRLSAMLKLKNVGSKIFIRFMEGMRTDSDQQI